MDERSHIPRLNGNRLKRLRAGHGLSVEEAARRAGISVAQVYRLEKGERPNVSAVVLTKLALALESSVEYLLGVTDYPDRLLPVQRTTDGQFGEQKR